MSTVEHIAQQPRVSFWNDPKTRSVAVQIIMVVVLVFALTIFITMPAPILRNSTKPSVMSFGTGQRALTSFNR